MIPFRKIIFMIFILSTFINAYEVSFFNKLTIPIAIAIQYANSEQEPLYKLYIKPGTQKSFVPGSIDIPDLKWSFCLKNIYYIKDPSMAQRAHNFAQATKLWKKVSITWVNKVLETTREFKPHRKPISEEQKPYVLGKKRVTPIIDKSLCKDRHFEITQDEFGNVMIIGSLVE